MFFVIHAVRKVSPTVSGLLVALLVLLILPLQSAEHWAYELPKRSATLSKNQHPIDALLEYKWREVGISRGAMADPRQWVERAAHTLTGLPPTMEQIQRIEKNPSEETWKAIVDEFLASPSYGERWARHWMDVARYADTQGYNFDRDNRYPYAYTYRDWLIRAFQNDMPYDQFVLRQLAADHLDPRPDHPDLAALGFLTVGPRLLREADTIDDKVDVITRGFLSSTVACARCHKHKSDPISMEDYYSIYSIIQHAKEPASLPVIGQPASKKAHQEFLTTIAAFDQKDREASQRIIEQLHAPISMAAYFDAAWLAEKENWNEQKTVSESFKRNDLRPKAVSQWRKFFQLKSQKESSKESPTESPDPFIAALVAELDAASGDVEKRQEFCKKWANEWSQAAQDSPLARLAKDPECPLSYDIEKVNALMHREDLNQKAKRLGERKKFEGTHPGAPPRAMSLVDLPKIGNPRIFHRGNPDDAGPVFHREWLSFLGGGKFPEHEAPRLWLAKKIIEPQNPLTARVMVNRVWGWHFGTPLADPSDFGPQEPVPPLLPLLDELALHFQESGWSVKDLHRFILTSRAYRLSAHSREENNRIDEMNSLFWKWNRRRSDFESMRDRLLFTSGSLQMPSLGGQPVVLHQAAADQHRSIYGFIDRFALPTYYISFDLPHPDHHAPKRAETTVPQQALWFLNDPLILRQSARLAKHAEFQAISNPAQRVDWLYQRIFQRLPSAEEKRLLIDWVSTAEPADYQPRLSGTWRALYAPDQGEDTSRAQVFPLFHEEMWKTGKDLAQAPVPFLHMGAKSGHVGNKHLLIFRWFAGGTGEVRLRGHLRRSQKGGKDLAWFIASSADLVKQSGVLKENGQSSLLSPWVSVKAGDTIDLVLNAPNGDVCGGVTWNLAIEGAEEKGGKIRVISDWEKDFPTTNRPIPAPTIGDPWADVIQMLWSSNEFHFIE